jgi:hypothetical protein
MKKLFVSLAIACSPAFAALTVIDIAGAVSCKHDTNGGFYIAEFTKQFGPAYKNEGEAAWFHGTGQLYGAQIKDVFVSTSTKYSFVGVVLEGPPPEVIKQIQVSRIMPTNVFPSLNGWVGSDGRNIVWHDKKYTKMFCLGDAARRPYQGE